MRDNFSQATKLVLAQRVNCVCSNPDCGATTGGPQLDPAKALNIGVAAHISAAANSGPRYDASLTAEQRSSPENGIWLCQNCGKKVDNDRAAYPVELLRAWKVIREFKALNSNGQTATSVTGNSSQSNSIVTQKVEINLPSALPLPKPSKAVALPRIEQTPNVKVKRHRFTTVGPSHSDDSETTELELIETFEGFSAIVVDFENEYIEGRTVPPFYCDKAHLKFKDNNGIELLTIGSTCWLSHSLPNIRLDVGIPQSVLIAVRFPEGWSAMSLTNKLYRGQGKRLECKDVSIPLDSAVVEITLIDEDDKAMRPARLLTDFCIPMFSLLP